MQVEAPNATGGYMPNPANSQFTGNEGSSTDDDKKFLNVTGTNTGISSHANGVGNFFYGDTISMTGGIGLCDDLSMDCPISQL